MSSYMARSSLRCSNSRDDVALEPSIAMFDRFTVSSGIERGAVGSVRGCQLAPEHKRLRDDRVAISIWTLAAAGLNDLFGSFSAIRLGS